MNMCCQTLLTKITAVVALSLDRSIVQTRHRSVAWSLGRSLTHAITRALKARSLDRSIAQSLDRSIARSLGRSVAPLSYLQKRRQAGAITEEVSAVGQ